MRRTGELRQLPPVCRGDARSPGEAAVPRGSRAGGRAGAAGSPRLREAAGNSGLGGSWLRRVALRRRQEPALRELRGAGDNWLPAPRVCETPRGFPASTVRAPHASREQPESPWLGAGAGGGKRQGKRHRGAGAVFAKAGKHTSGSSCPGDTNPTSQNRQGDEPRHAVTELSPRAAAAAAAARRGRDSARLRRCCCCCCWCSLATLPASTGVRRPDGASAARCYPLARTRCPGWGRSSAGALPAAALSLSRARNRVPGG